jgi:PRTRC genetic system ThiF family protein
MKMPDYKSLHIVLVGCGGTGGWVAPGLARITRLIQEQERKVTLYFVDPDFVEPKNVFRQNFSQAEVAMRINKAVTLAARYGSKWGLEINAIPKKIEECGFDWADLTLYIGCVDDSSRGRLGILKKMVNTNSKALCIDSGNGNYYGQVLFGTNVCTKKALIKTFETPGFNLFLPPPYIHHPDLLIVEESKQANSDQINPNMSCAEIALRDSQGMTINQMMASIVVDYVMRLLIKNDLDKYATYVDMDSGSMSSKYITGENVKSMYCCKNLNKILRML